MSEHDSDFWSDGAIAGMRQILSGDSGCPLLELTDHEVTDLAFSGRAFGTLKKQDGTTELVEIVDTTREMRKIVDLWRSEGRVKSI